MKTSEFYKYNGFTWQLNIDDMFIRSTHLLYSKVRSALGDVENKKILDAGCGIGSLFPYISGSTYHGIDISHENISICKKTHQGIFTEENILCMDYPDNYFDGLASVEVIEHLTLKELNIFLNEIKRVTKPGAKIVFSTPNLYYLWGIIPWSFNPIRRRLTFAMLIDGIKNGYVNENYNIPSHHYRFKPKFIKDFISNHLKVESVKSTYWYNNRAIHKINPNLQMKILNFSFTHNPDCFNIGMQLIIECINVK